MTMNPACPVCEGNTEAFAKPKEVAVGRWSRSIDVVGFKCGQCGEEFFAPGQMQAALKEAARLVRESRGLVSPERIKALRERHRLTQGQLEKLLNIGPKTVARWERGSVVPTLASSRFIETLEAHPEVVVEMAARYEVAIRPAASIGWWMQSAIPVLKRESILAFSQYGMAVNPEMSKERVA
jgi:HTH-type transcriptional regulator/antitoxin MqsA